MAEEDNDLKDYNRLVQQTQKKLTILDDEPGQVSVMSSSAAAEQSDEFIRNFFIKFGMKSTLESF